VAGTVAQVTDEATAGRRADDELLGRIYAAEIDSLVALGRMLTGDVQAGEDLAHEVFLRAARQLRRTPGYLREPARPWLRTALVRAAIDWRRRARREMQRLVRSYQRPAEAGMPDGAIDCVAALGQLPVRMRACVVLSFGEDLSVAATAAALGCSPRTVENQLRTARRRLATLLGDQDPLPEDA
jgi:RNA polymerase sigma factor (sigma-70 family)